MSSDSFRSGRTRRLTLTWNFSVNGLYRAIPPHGQGFRGVTGFNIQWAGFEVWGGSVTDACQTTYAGEFPHGFMLPQPSGPNALTYVMQIKLPGAPYTGFDGYFNAYGPWGQSGQPFPVAAYKTTPQTVPTNLPVSGTVTLWMDVEEWKAISVDTQTPRVPLDYPTSGKGPNDDDFIGLSTLAHSELPKPGGHFGFSISIAGGYGSSGSWTIPANLTCPDPHYAFAMLYLKPLPTETVSGAVQALSLNGLPVNFDLLQCSDDGYQAGGDASGNLSVSDTNATQSGPYLVLANCAPDTSIAVDGLTTRVFESNYGESVDYRRSWASPALVSKANGVYAGAEGYREQAIQVQRCDSGTTTILFANGAAKPALFVWLDNSWMGAHGEIQKDWRILIADDVCWSPFGIYHKPTSLIDDFASVQGWSGSHVTLGQGSGTMTMAVSGGTGSATKAYGEDASQYRKLRLRAKASASATMRVRLNGSALYFWDLTVTPTMSDYVLDLCAPGGASASSDLTDSSYVAPGQYYGPRTITSVTFENLADGRTYTVDRLEFARTGGMSYTVLPPFDESVVGDDGIERRRLCWGLCDRRQVLDLPYQMNDAPGDRFLTVSELIALIQGHDAYDARIQLPLPGEAAAYYFDRAHRPAAFMASERYVAGRRIDQADVAAGAMTPVWCLMRFDMVSIYAGIGDPAGAFGGSYPLRFTKRLQMSAHGLAIDNTSHRAAAGETVALKLGAVQQQTKRTDSDGYFRFAPFKPLAGAWKVGTSTSGDIALLTGLTDRKYRWAGLAGAGVSGGMTAAVADQTGRLYVAYTDAGAVMCRRVDLTGDVSDALVKAVECGGLGITWSPPHRLWFIFSQPGGVALRTSCDDGKTWGDEVVVFSSGDQPNVLADPATGLLYAFRHDGTGIGCKRSLDGGATWQTEVAVVASCPAQQCGATVRPDLAQTIFVTYKDDAGAVRMVRSRDNGVSWG